MSDPFEPGPDSDDPDRPVRLILDTSAIVAFTRASIHVGELLAEVDDEAGAVALPLPCLVEGPTFV